MSSVSDVKESPLYMRLFNLYKDPANRHMAKVIVDFFLTSDFRHYAEQHAKIEGILSQCNLGSFQAKDILSEDLSTQRKSMGVFLLERIMTVEKNEDKIDNFLDLLLGNAAT